MGLARVGDPSGPLNLDLTRSWRESWAMQDFRFSKPIELIQVLARIHKFAAPKQSAPPVEESPFSSLLR